MERVFIDHLILYTLFGVTTVWLGPVYRDQFCALLQQVNGAKGDRQIEFWVPPIALDLVLPDISVDAADAEDWLQQLRSHGLNISEVYDYQGLALAEGQSPEAAIKHYVSQVGCALLTCHAQRYQDIDSPAIVLSLDACPTVADLYQQLDIRRRLTRLYTNPSLGEVAPIDRSPPSGPGFVTTGLRPQSSVGGFPVAASLVLLVAVVNYLDFWLRSHQEMDWQQAHRLPPRLPSAPKSLAGERQTGAQPQRDRRGSEPFLQPPDLPQMPVTSATEAAWHGIVPLEPGSVRAAAAWLSQESWLTWTGDMVASDGTAVQPSGAILGAMAATIAEGLLGDRNRLPGLTDDQAVTGWQPTWRGSELLVTTASSLADADPPGLWNAPSVELGFGHPAMAAQPLSLLADADPSQLLREPTSPAPTDRLPLLTRSPLPPVDPFQIYESGVFTTTTGAITIDFLFDGGADEGQLGIFSLAGLELYDPGSSAFRQAVVERVLSRSQTGHIVIADRGDDLNQGDGARFTFPGLGVDNPNLAPYQGAVSFTLQPGARFGFVLLPNGTFRQLHSGAMSYTYDQLLFSLRTRSLNSSLNTTQVINVFNDPTLQLGAGQILGWDDRRVEPTRSGNPANSPDYNDLVIRVHGAAGSLPSLDRLTRGDDVWWPLRFPGRPNNIANSTSPVPQSGLD